MPTVTPAGVAQPLFPLTRTDFTLMPSAEGTIFTVSP